MSAFLGPIHYWLYNKIKLQQELVEDIIKLSQDLKIPDIHLKEDLDVRYGVFDTKPLEEIIDTGNIHGWLQSRVSQAEYKLAGSVTILLEKNPELIEDIKQIFETRGMQKSVAYDSAADIYKAISDSLLDGMPCDNANSLLENSEDKVVWRRNTCVHSSYWDEAGGDINIYYILREAFIRGFLSQSPFVYEKLDESTSIIRKK